LLDCVIKQTMVGYLQNCYLLKIIIILPVVVNLLRRSGNI